MRTRVLSLCLMALCLTAPACPPAPVPPPDLVPEAGTDSAVDAIAPSIPDAAPNPAQDALSPPPSACAQACANLNALGCPEGAKLPDCVDTCLHADGKITNLAPACLATAKTKAAARKCGSVRCP